MGENKEAAQEEETHIDSAVLRAGDDDSIQSIARQAGYTALFLLLLRRPDTLGNDGWRGAHFKRFAQDAGLHVVHMDRASRRRRDAKIATSRNAYSLSTEGERSANCA